MSQTEFLEICADQIPSQPASVVTAYYLTGLGKYSRLPFESAVFLLCCLDVAQLEG